MDESKINWEKFSDIYVDHGVEEMFLELLDRESLIIQKAFADGQTDRGRMLKLFDLESGYEETEGQLGKLKVELKLVGIHFDQRMSPV